MHTFLVFRYFFYIYLKTSLINHNSVIKIRIFKLKRIICYTYKLKKNDFSLYLFLVRTLGFSMR